MADQDWDSNTVIGSKTRGGGSARETVIKGKAALNAAQRTGAVVATEKKYSSANAADKGVEGQRLTKVDRSDDVIAPPKTDADLAKNIQQARADAKLSQKQLAQKCNLQATQIQELESGKGIKDQKVINAVCRNLKLSPKTGEPLPSKGPKTPKTG